MAVFFKNKIIEDLLKWQHRIFYHNVKIRRAAAPHVLNPLFLVCHSIINNDDISFKFCI